MQTTLVELDKVERLLDTGRHAEVITYVDQRGPPLLDRSPTLALYYGIARGRLGQYAEATRWVELALTRARQRGDRRIKTRALSVSGAIALEQGRIDDAAKFFVRALSDANQERDHGTVGRCANNLGIVANIRGRHERAIASLTMALAAFQRAGSLRGIAETQNNLRIVHRDRGKLEAAMDAADRAIETADLAEDAVLTAYAVAGRAEIRALIGESRIALLEVEWALASHRTLRDVVGEAEALRILAAVRFNRGENADTERTLHDVIQRAQGLKRPLLVAEAERDLARLMTVYARFDEARACAARAKAAFESIGASGEAIKLDSLIGP